MLSTPVFLDTLTDESIHRFISDFKSGGFSRVFVCGFPELGQKSEVYDAAVEKFRKYSAILRKEGLEVGIWVSAFGHGARLMHDAGGEVVDFERLQGPDGRTAGDSFCPASEEYRASYCRMIARYAEGHPDLLMLDDDFRLSHRAYGIGCYCPLHLALYNRRAKKKVADGKELFHDAFLSEDKSARRAWLSVLAQSLYDFASEVRRAIDSVDASIRCGACMCMDTWDLSGTDAASLARAFAGNTRPFLRTIGAPYWDALSEDGKLAHTVEYTRMQLARRADKRYRDIEFMTEGDAYPRYRTQVPAALLELYHLSLISVGSDEILKYVFDYAAPYGYENGYVEAHLKNKEKREAFRALFAGKTPVGIEIWEEEHRIAEYECTDAERAQTELLKSFFPRAVRLFSSSSIPTCYEGGDYPVAVLGESARHIPVEKLKNGVILDKRAAELLEERGIDTGLLEARPTSDPKECFRENEWLLTAHPATYALKAKEGARILSYYEPSHMPSSYLYENKNGLRFFLLGYDAYALTVKEGERALVNYYRARTLEEATEWLSSKKLPAVCRKCPSLYLVSSRGEDGSLAVALINMHADTVYSPKIYLDASYQTVRFVDTDGELVGDTLRLSKDIPPYSAVAFEVK